MKKAILINDTSSERHHGCNTVINQIDYFFDKFNIKIIYYHDTNSSFSNFKKYQKKFNPDFDILLINGEGSIHNSNIKSKNIIEIGIWTKNVLKKKVVLFNSVFQNMSNELIKKISYFDLIYIRDSLSHSFLNKNNIVSIYVPDIVLSFKKKIKTFSNHDHIIFTDSVFRDQTHELLKLSKEIDNSLFLPLSTSPSKKYFKTYFRFFLRYYVLKIPFIFNKYKNFDYEVQKKYVNFDNFLKNITSSKINICGRYHAIIFSIIYKIPFIAIKSNTHKVESLLMEIGLENRLINIKNINMKIITNLSEFKKKELILIDDFLNKSHSKIKNMFTSISKL